MADGIPDGDGASDRGDGYPLPVENPPMKHKQPDLTIQGMALGDHGGFS